MVQVRQELQCGDFESRLLLQMRYSKDIPVTGCGGPNGCERLRLPHYLHKWLLDGGKVESTPGPVRPEGLGQFKNPTHPDLNPRPSGLQHSALTTTLPRASFPLPVSNPTVLQELKCTVTFPCCIWAPQHCLAGRS
jgi:hypothetical protein